MSKEERIKYWFLMVGFFTYGVAGMMSTSFLPLFKDYRYLESASYASVIWTTVAVWHVFRELRERNVHLSALDQMKRDFISHVTHEFRTPLNAIESAVEFLMGLSKDELRENLRVDEYLHLLQSNVGRLSEFVDELLDLATIQHSKVRLSLKMVDLYALSQKVIDLLRPISERTNTSVKLEGEPAIVSCDEEKIQQVISNLLSNALKAAPGGQVLIIINQIDGYAQLSIEDNGIGIPQEELKNIFSSFYQVSHDRNTFKGTGLGLAIAKGWVESHGGRIWAESLGVNCGTRFTFSLFLIQPNPPNS